ncbi:acyl-CoA dehydrogenase family protein [Chloroflexota bacterium]
MGGFGFTEAQEMLRNEAKRFAQTEIAPSVKEWAKHGYNPEEIPRETEQKIIDMGWTALNLPEKYGGQKIDFVSLGVITEELCKVDIFFGIYPQRNYLPSIVLEKLPTEVQDEWYPHLINITKRPPCYGFTEAGCGSDAVAIQTRAVREGDYYIVNGEKQPVSFIGIDPLSAIIASVKTDPTAGARGVSLLWIPMDLPGITRAPISWMGQRESRPGIVNFDNVRVPVKYLIGEEGKGFYEVMGLFDVMRVLGCALKHLAPAEASLEEAIAWAKQRTAFGQPIAKFEGVSFKIADHYANIQAAKLLCYRTLWLRDQGLRHTKESAVAKAFSIPAAINALYDCMIIFGHVGYSEDYPIEKRLRDAMGELFGDGTPQILKLVIARELIGKEAIPY